ncbi:MAG: hypothetical protein KA385_06950 [Vicinamibacteria bacterium]|nr:hypothetical protein [Vicinamibacteria bacterium]
MFDELERWGGAILLFLRKILHLEVDVLYDDHIEHYLNISTSTPGAVKNARSHLVEAVSSNLTTWLHSWKDGSATQQSAVYEHRFHITTQAFKREEKFLVAGALIPRGEALLNAADAMNEIPERALPWIGAAIPLAIGDEAQPRLRVDERLFCTLPLTQSANLPFFLNGAFDLDASRTHITYGAKSGDRQVRSNWNNALLIDAAPQVIANLLNVLRERIGDHNPAAFYEMWPSQQEAGPVADLVRAVYLRLSTEPLLRIRENGVHRWVSSNEARAPNQWSKELRDAALADGLALLDPQPPSHVLNGLDDVSAQPRAWTADEVRSWLRVAKDPACPLGDAPRAVLRDRHLVMELTRRYGVGHNIDRTGLPFVIMADGRLRAFNRGTSLYIASPEIQHLFPDARQWFADTEFVTDTGLGPDRDARLLEFDIRLAVQTLCKRLQPLNGTTWRDWTPTSPLPPSEAWLQDVLRYLGRHDLRAYRAQLRTACLLPDEQNRLHSATSTAPPLCLPEGTSEQLKEALRAFGVPILQGSLDLTALLGMVSRKMDTPIGTDLLPQLNGNAVVNALSPEAVIVVDASTRGVLLDWLSEEHHQSHLDGTALERLRTLKLWPDEQGMLSAADERPLYLPSGYQPPHHLPRYRLLFCGQDNRWRPLLQALKVPVLSISVVASAIIDQVASTPDDLAILQDLRWLRDEVASDRIREEDGEEIAREVQNKLRSHRIIPSSSGERVALKELYHPDDTEVIETLGPLARHPNLKMLSNNDDDRSHWLRWMALRRTPTINDIFLRIGELIAQAQTTGTASIEDAMCRVFQHLNNPERWKNFRDWSVSVRGPTLAEKLRSLSWLPAVRSDPQYLATPGFILHEDRLYRPSEGYRFSVRNQVASQAPVFAIWPHDKMCEDLHFPIEVPLAIVVAHLRHVRDLWDGPNHTDLDGAAIDDMSRGILTKLGQASATLTVQDQSALRMLADEPCIWHPETQRFWKPASAFLQSVPGLAPLRVHISAADAVRRGLLRMGVRTEPGPGDYVSFLGEVAELHRKQVLPEGMRRNVLWAWQRLAEGDEGSALSEHPPVLTRDGKLVDPAQVLEDDAPWWRSRLDSVALPFLALGVPLSAARIAGVRSAAKEIEELLLDEGANPAPEVIAIVLRFRGHLCQREFRNGLLRLLADAHHLTLLMKGEEAITDALRLQLVAASFLKTELRCSTLYRDERFGEGETDSFLDKDRLLLALDDNEAAAHEIAAVINRRLPDVLRLADLSALEAILRCSAEKIEEILDRRKIRVLPTEAERLDLSDLDPQDSVAQKGVVSGETDVVEKSQDLTTPEPTEAGGAPPAQSGGPSRPALPQATPGGLESPTLRPVVNRATAPGSATVPSPLIPGDGTSHAQVPQSHGRLRSYISPSPGSFNGISGAVSASSVEIELAAVKYVLAEARKSALAAEQKTTDHAGRWLQIAIPGESLPRYVVVKGLSGAWDRKGIALTKDELMDAQEQGKRFWLNVVEYALDPKRATLVPIQDPWSKIYELRLDDGWRATATASFSRMPTVGSILYQEEILLGEIVEIQLMGPLQRLRIRPPEGEIRNIFFSPSLHHVTAKENIDGENDS